MDENQRDPFCFYVEWLHSCLCSQTNSSGRKQNCLLTCWITNYGMIRHIRDLHWGSSRSWFSTKLSSVSSFPWSRYRSWVPAPPGILIQLKPGTNSSPRSAPSGINSSLYQEQPELFVVALTWTEAAWMKKCVWDELPGYTSSSAKQLQFAARFVNPLWWPSSSVVGNWHKRASSPQR